MSLEEAIHIMKCYETVNLKPSETLLMCDLIINNFKFEFDAIKEHKKKEVSTPQTGQKLDIVHCTEAFFDFLSRMFGVRNISLACVVRTIDKMQIMIHLLS